MRMRLSFRPGPGLNWLLLRNVLLNLVSLRLYRFWTRTELRRHLWASLKIGDDPLEYTGQGWELFLGFAIVFAVLAPIYMVLNGLLVINTSHALAVLVFDVWLAISVSIAAAGRYSARSYRLSRTLWRGLYAGQGGSPWRYAWRFLGWSAAFLCTAGLSVPWACEDLARYTLRHTTWGSYRGQFHGQARQLLRAWIPVWAVCFGPLCVLCLWRIYEAGGDAGVIIWDAAYLFDLINQRDGSKYLYSIVAIMFCILAAWTYFHIAWLEWYLDQSLLGPLEFSCHLPDGIFRRRIHGLSLAVVYAAGVLAFLIHFNLDGLIADWDYSESVWACLAVVFFAMTGFSAIWLRYVEIPLLQEVFAGTYIDHIDEIAAIRQTSPRPPAFGEGLWDIGHAHIF
jgi:uncharacterized membrane protein YjgN (DUF898 family)